MSKVATAPFGLLGDIFGLVNSLNVSTNYGGIGLTGGGLDIVL